MKIETHLEKIQHLDASLRKLNDDTDYEAIIELIMLLTNHYVNAAMHKLNTLRIDKDEKHNKMYSVLVHEKRLRNYSDEVWTAIEKIENLRPKHVYGSGTNGKYSKDAKKQYEIIKRICRRILNV